VRFSAFKKKEIKVGSLKMRLWFVIVACSFIPGFAGQKI